MSSTPADSIPDGDVERVRSDASAYADYLARMDASMKQKVALTAAHLLGAGTVADMGMGSGAGSYALAKLYPEVEVIGVDLDPNMVTHAASTHRAPNLRFVQGDVSERCLDEDSVDGIFNSSVLHHVTSFGGYAYRNATRALAAQAEMLTPGGTLIVRDFLAPAELDVILELPTDDGRPNASEVTVASSAALFQRFAKEFRKLSDAPGFEYVELAPGRFACSLRHAVEFILRKDYRDSWDAEVREEYTYFTQAEFELQLRELGLRLTASTPILNPWIVRNRFEGQFVLTDLDGELLDHPSTNIVVAAERPRAGEGIDFEQCGAAEGGYLQLEHFVRVTDGQVYDVARRPNPTVDIVPFFEREGRVFVLARGGYPRPVLRGADATSGLLGQRHGPYLLEPLTTSAGREREGLAMLGIESASDAGIPGLRYYPSPGGLAEQVRSRFVRVEPSFEVRPLVGLNEFSTSGVMRAVDAHQLLRAAQVDGLPEARLELNVVALLEALGHPLGPYIGEVVAPSEVSVGIEERTPRRPRAVFDGAPESAGFLVTKAGHFAELDGSGGVVAEGEREWIVPAHYSARTVSLAIVGQTADGPALALDEDDLPAAQRLSGRSDLDVLPAWRLPKEVSGLRSAEAFIRERALKEYGVELERVTRLGGAYYPSAGVTPELVEPFIATIGQLHDRPQSRPLRFVSIATARLQQYRDGHLLVALGRLKTLFSEPV